MASREKRSLAAVDLYAHALSNANTRALRARIRLSRRGTFNGLL